MDSRTSGRYWADLGLISYRSQRKTREESEVEIDADSSQEVNFDDFKLDTGDLETSRLQDGRLDTVGEGREELEWFQRQEASL